jgi:hypothetical protein
MNDHDRFIDELLRSKCIVQPGNLCQIIRDPEDGHRVRSHEYTPQLYNLGEVQIITGLSYDEARQLADHLNVIEDVMYS